MQFQQFPKSKEQQWQSTINIQSNSRRIYNNQRTSEHHATTTNEQHTKWTKDNGHINIKDIPSTHVSPTRTKGACKWDGLQYDR
ncbi:MAG: hypothetical protein ACXADW_23485, partial [Candidatus Hodarchaeales archaeon]